ncbi:hypothetical protein Hanom_Chr11g01027571 [Helianthus anomalus]
MGLGGDCVCKLGREVGLSGVVVDPISVSIWQMAAQPSSRKHTVVEVREFLFEEEAFGDKPR